MDHSASPRSLSWTSLVVLTLLAAFVEAMILFPSTIFPTTRFAAALSWDASQHDYPSPETPVGETPATPEAVTPAPPAPAPQAPAPTAPAARRGDARAIAGRVLDAATGAPLRGASIWSGPTEIVTNAEGRFTTGPVDSGATVWVKAPGYERKKLTGGEATDVTVKLAPHPVRAAYLTYYGVADRTIRQRVLDLVERTELNAVVIDVKGDRGLIPYRTSVQAAARRGRAGAGHHQGLRRAARRLEGAGHLHHRPDRGLQGQRARHDPARPGGHRHPHRQAVDRPREPGVGGSVPRRELGLHHRGGEGSGAQGLRRDPVRLRALPHRRQAGRRALLAAQLRRPRGCPPSRRSWPRPGASWGRPACSWARTSSATPPSTRTTPTSGSASRRSR